MADAKIQKGPISDIYRKIAPSYDLWARLTESRARDRCLELAAIQNGEDVLEVAVGTGLAFDTSGLSADDEAVPDPAANR